MSISIERLYRVTTPNGAVSDLTEDQAQTLAVGLLSALGIAPAPVVAATIEPPAQLPSGPVRDAAPASTGAPPLKMGDWTPDLPELKRLMTEGLSVKEIAARLNRPVPATNAQYYKLLRKAKAASAPSDPPAVAEAAPLPPTEPPAWTPDGAWTPAQTQTLIRAMAPGGRGIREASEQTGHSMGGCGLRWKHLKGAGLMTVEQYLSSPEATP
jgi:DNA-binding NarL/FixJ family response regulator